MTPPIASDPLTRLGRASNRARRIARSRGGLDRNANRRANKLAEAYYQALRRRNAARSIGAAGWMDRQSFNGRV